MAILDPLWKVMMANRSSLRATDEQKTALADLARSDVRGEADRVRAMLLTLAGWISGQIAEAFGVTADSVRHWRQWFAEGGIEALRSTLAPGASPQKGLTGFGNTVTFGNGNNDSATLTGGGGSPIQNNTVTLGNGKHDSVTLTAGGFSTIQNNTVTLGNGNRDSVTLTGGGGSTIRNNTVTLGNGNNDSVTLTGGSNDTVTLGSGKNDSVTLSSEGASVHGGARDTINLMNGSAVTIYGNHEMVFLDSSSNIVADHSTGMQLNIGPTAGNDVLYNFASDPTGVIILHGDIGGFATRSAVLAALTSDGSGGTKLSFGVGSSLDIVNVLPTALTAANFRIA